MCHSATARPTHGVVVGRAVFVAWNPPTTTRSRTGTGFVFCFSHFAVRDVLQYQRRPRRSPRRPLPEWSAVSAVQLSSLEPVRGVPARFAHLILQVPASPPAGRRQSLLRVSSFAVFLRVAPQAVLASVSPPGSSAVPASSWSAVPVRVVRRPRLGRPPSSCECQIAVPVRVVRRPRQGRPPSSFYGSLSSASPSGSSSAKAPSPPGSSAVPTRVTRQARVSGRPPSPPMSPAQLFLRVPKRGPRPPGVLASRPPSSIYIRVGGVCRPPSPSGSSAIPARCECQKASSLPGSPVKLFQRALVCPRQGRPPSPAGSPAKLVLRVCRPPSPSGSPSPPGFVGPARVVRRPRQGGLPSSFCECQ